MVWREDLAIRNLEMMSKVPRDGECWDDTYNFYSVRADGTQRAATLLFLERLLGL